MLYRIERDLFEADERQAEGVLAQARAARILADIELERTEQLLAREVGTEQQRDIARVGSDRAEGAVAQAEASLATARINLGYTEILAPVAGRIVIRRTEAELSAADGVIRETGFGVASWEDLTITIPDAQ